MPFPDVVYRCLTNQLVNAKDNKIQTFAAISEQRKLLEAKHRSCGAQSKRDLNVMFKVTKAEANEFKVIKRREMISEISDLIKVSNWQNIVDTDKICNLTNNEVSTLELEALSLG